MTTPCVPAAAASPGTPRGARPTSVTGRRWYPAAFWCADLAGQWSRRLGHGGGTLPGRLTASWVPDALPRLAAGHRIALVSGTNGKTTTTALLGAALGTLGPVVTNSDGANLTSGILSTLLRARQQPAGWAVLEVDEVALEPVLAQLDVELLVLLNLSRDQLDRTNEVSDHVTRWSRALAAAPPVTVVANSDDALVVAAVLAARPAAERVVWVAAGKTYREDSVLCPRCGHGWPSAARGWRCDSCALAQPPADWRVEADGRLTRCGDVVPLALPLPGLANRGNAAMALAAAQHAGTRLPAVLDRLAAVTQIRGRYALLREAGRDVRLLLAKNPAGWAEALRCLGDRDTPVVIALNARPADGLDTSWLWDVPFEVLAGRPVVASGERAGDLSVRLTYADVAHRLEPQPREAVRHLPPGSCDLVANYTAFAPLARQAATPPPARRQAAAPGPRAA